MDTSPQSHYDVVVYGSSGAGFSASVQAARSGLSVLLIEPGPRIGGMTTGGLGATDIGNCETIGGIAAEFYHRIYLHYKNENAWFCENRVEYLPKHRDSIHEQYQFHFFFEPSVSLHIMQQMLAECNVDIWRQERLDRTTPPIMENNRITQIQMCSGRTASARFFVDASYEGDLMAMAGVPYFLGREDNHLFDETLNGFRPSSTQPEAEHVDPYIIPGQPSGGLLPGIESQPDLIPGQADHRIQAYNFRLCLTDYPPNRKAVTKPDSYDPLYYEALARYMLTLEPRCKHFPFFKRTPVPNLKTDSNNFGIFSTDFVGESHAWPEADDKTRQTIWQRHRDYTQGLLWFLGNDPRLPEQWRAEVKVWGLACDEFTETDNWPSQLYVREARRMKGLYIITESDCTGYTSADDLVAFGSYAMDSHQVSRYVDTDGKLRSEGGFWKTCAPYPISYRALIPDEKHCSNLIVPVCLSATHAAYGSVRMEPVFMMLGQSAALAIQTAIRQKRNLQQIDYPELRDKLLNHGAILKIPDPVPV